MRIILFIFFGFVRACQHHMRPVYNQTNRQYISCNAWEPECASGTVCQLASREWKRRLNVNSDYTLFLCCGEDNYTDGTRKPGSPLDWELKTKTPLVPTPVTQTPPITSPSFLNFVSNFENAKLESSPSSSISWPSTVSTQSFETEKYSKEKDLSEFFNAKQANALDQIQFQPPFSPTRIGRPTSSPLLPPVPQIIVPGNGVRYEQPRVTQLLVGQLTTESADGTFKWSGTSALVQDNGINILVDTSSAQNKNKLLAALAVQGLKPQNIQIVIYTSAHPAHMGNDNMFPYAEKIFATFVYKGDEWLAMKQLKEPNVRLTHNVEIWQTPGRNDMHNSVIVRNVPDQGSVAVSGNVFFNEASVDDPNAWSRFAKDRELLSQVRNMLICQADFIVPGYGASFAVGRERKASAGCATKRYKRPTHWLRRFKLL